ALVGVGASVLCSISLGEKHYDKARVVLSNVIILNLVLGILFTVVGLLFLDPILIFFGASPNTLPAAREYMRVILIGNVFAHMYL
ncbi:MAG: MATE family efflux transporter, partial [Bacteroidales bacterium]|nr:MATE family efflux transporter [Bacteroidales bacterium]